MLNETNIREIFSKELDLSHQLVNLGALGDVILLILVLIIALIGYCLKSRKESHHDDTVSSNPSVQQFNEHIQKQYGSFE